MKYGRRLLSYRLPNHHILRPFFIIRKVIPWKSSRQPNHRLRHRRNSLSSPPHTLSFNEKLTAYVDLTKPRITSLVVLSSLAGFALGRHASLDWIRLLHTAIGVALLSGGINALNQYWERDLDALMRRTKIRPLPAGKLARPRRARFRRRGFADR